MSKIVLYMSMAPDGFVAGPNMGPGNGLGDGGHRLHEWGLPGADASHEGAAGHLAGVNREVMDELMSTAAVVAGRRKAHAPSPDRKSAVLAVREVADVIDRS